ncbi:hypothetical protein C1H46_015575 [Malus baccata]|uniref:14-3-3 domain-containing protein n=1 Tax=Malus baccata TaxID=106549 RepID=A0A540ML52_MALBA|nr:hypothetical protein C1H46_015575 [Malus baccata]
MRPLTPESEELYSGFLLLSSPAPMVSAVPENLSREQYVYLVKLAEQVERYEEMVSFMEKLVVGSIVAKTELTVEERNLFNIAYKNVESELFAICAGILELLQSHLVPSATTGESKVFYLKMKDDYHRYIAGFKNGIERKTAAQDTLDA